MHPNFSNVYANGTGTSTMQTHHKQMNGSNGMNTIGTMNGYGGISHSNCNGTTGSTSTSTSTTANHHQDNNNYNNNNYISSNPYYVHYSDRVAIIGAGVAGIATAAALQSAGYNNFTVYEKQSSMGGLWVQNYPNVAGTLLNFCVFFVVVVVVSLVLYSEYIV
jgi:NAD(P)-binding Rossmann-like domain